MEKLNTYKELLDTGIISQEEYTQKKNEIFKVDDVSEVIIEGTVTSNKIFNIIIVACTTLSTISFFVADYIFKYGTKQIRYYGYYDRSYHSFYGDFTDFYLEEFFTQIYGYMLLFGIIGIIVSIIGKLKTEKCELKVYTDKIIGKSCDKRNMEITFDKVTAVERCECNGVSIIASDRIYKVYLLNNR